MENAKLVQDLQKQMNHFKVRENFSEIVILCIGTDKLVGDLVGPVVGEQLTDKLQLYKKIRVYGNMQETLNFKNARQVLNSIITNYDNPFMIGIDSALGKEEMVNKIIVGRGKIPIGSALGRNLCYPTHVHIKAVVGEYKETAVENIETLKNVNAKNINIISNKITNGICKMIETF